MSRVGLNVMALVAATSLSFAQSPEEDAIDQLKNHLQDQGVDTSLFALGVDNNPQEKPGWSVRYGTTSVIRINFGRLYADWYSGGFIGPLVAYDPASPEAIGSMLLTLFHEYNHTSCCQSNEGDVLINEMCDEPAAEISGYNQACAQITSIIDGYRGAAEPIPPDVLTLLHAACAELADAKIKLDAQKDLIKFC